MVLPQSVSQVLLVVFLHQTLVIHKKYISGDWNSSVAVVGCCGRIEKLEPPVALFALWRFFVKCETKKAVELACSYRVLCMFADLGNLAKDEADGLFLQC
mgnify:CR=1 FL=1